MTGGTTGVVSAGSRLEQGLRLVIPIGGGFRVGPFIWVVSFIVFTDTCPYLLCLAGALLRDGMGGKWISLLWVSGDMASVVVAVGCDDGSATFFTLIFLEFPFSFVNLENARFGLNFDIFAH